MQSTTPPSQAAREAAAQMIRDYWLGGGHEKMHHLADRMERGFSDHATILQAFARFERDTEKRVRESLAGDAWDGPLTAEEQAMIDGAWERHKAAAPCTIPPKGWRCTRDAGHDGPCAALSVESLAGEANVERVALGIYRADYERGGQAARDNWPAPEAIGSKPSALWEQYLRHARAALATLERTTVRNG